MLLLTRRASEEIIINENIRLIVQQIKGNSVRISIEAPREISVRRGELINFQVNLIESEHDSTEARKLSV